MSARLQRHPRRRSIVLVISDTGELLGYVKAKPLATAKVGTASIYEARTATGKSLGTVALRRDAVALVEEAAA